MTRNMSTVDRKLRGYAAAPMLLLLALLAGVGTVTGLVLLALAIVMAVTAAVGFCPLYAAIHISTNSSKPMPHSPKGA
jgi:hypothetical protein